MGGLLIFYKTIYITSFCAILCFGWSVQGKTHVHVPPAVALLFRQQSEVCSKETGVHVGMMKQIVTGGPIPDDEATKKYLYCVTYNSGYTDANGHYIVEAMSNLQPMNGTKEDYINSIKTCNKITLDNPLDTVREMGVCIHNDNTFTL